MALSPHACTPGTAASAHRELKPEACGVGLLAWQDHQATPAAEPFAHAHAAGTMGVIWCTPSVHPPRSESAGCALPALHTHIICQVGIVPRKHFHA